MGISSVGIGSGLDVKSIVAGLVDLEKLPLVKLQKTAVSIDTKISTFGQVKSLMSTFADAAAKLTRDSAWSTMAVTSSNSSAVTARVSGVASATAFSVSVSQLASTQTVSSAPLSKDAPVGAGTLSIQLGKWTPATDPTFEGKAGATVATVTIDATDTLSEIAAKINDSDSGVTATVLRDASGERLLMRSKDTGEESGFKITATEAGAAGAAGLGRLGFDPQGAPGAGMAGNPVQYAQNTQAKINGVSISSPGNTLDDVIPGLSLTVSQVTTANVEMTVAADTSVMKKNIQDFVDAYNAVNDLLGSSTKYDGDSKTAGVFQGDSTAVGLQNTLRMMMMANTSGASGFQRLSDLGIDFQRGGALKITGSKLDEALKNPQALKTMFSTNVSPNSESNGLAVKVKSLTDTLLSYDGLLNNKSDALETSNKRNKSEQDKVNERAARLQVRLQAQYSALDKRMGSLTVLNSYINQQVSQWNKSQN